MEKSTVGPSRASPSSAYERKFRVKWLSDPRFSGWLSQSPSNPNKAYCIICERELAGSATFLERHKSTTKHISLSQDRNTRGHRIIRQGNGRSSIQSENISEWKISSYVWREGLSLSCVGSLSGLIQSLSVSPHSPLTPSRALSLLQTMGQTHRDSFFGSTLRQTPFSLVFLQNTAVIRYVDPPTKSIKTAHFPWRDESLTRLVPWGNLMATLNAPQSALDLIQKAAPGRSFLCLESMERQIEEITTLALEALPQECVSCSWEIAKFISGSKTDHFKDFHDLLLRKGGILPPADRKVLKGGKGLSLEEIVEFIASNWSSLMFWLSSLELIEGSSSSFLQGLYEHPLMELYFAFLNYILPCLSKMKAEFLCEDFRLFRLKSSLQNSIRSILHNFIDSSGGALESMGMLHRDTYLNLNEVYRGANSREILKKMDPSQVGDFYFKTFNFYIHLEKGLLEHFSSSSPWSLDGFEALDPINALRGRPGSLIPLASRLPFPQSRYERLDQEWRELSVYRDEDRLSCEAGNPEAFWKRVAEERIGSGHRFPILSNLALSVLTIAHSSVCVQPFMREANEVEAAASSLDALPLLLFAKDYLRNTDSSWEPPPALIEFSHNNR